MGALVVNGADGRTPRARSPFPCLHSWPHVSLCSHTLDPFMPVTAVLEGVRARFERLGLPASFNALRLHVFSESATEEALKPTFFTLYLAHHFTGAGASAAQRRKRLHELVDHLEAATILCAQASVAMPKPLRALLDDAREHCARFDAVAADESRVRERQHRACVAGGKARQAASDPARRRAARLILVCAPPGGWRNRRHAARTIRAKLEAFVRARGISLLYGDSLERTVERWIRTLDFVRAAYDASSRRSRVLSRTT
jgi:hypothetical protein